MVLLNQFWPCILNVWSCSILQHPQKLVSSIKLQELIFQFSRQKFEFYFLAPKNPDFSTFLILQNFYIKQSCLNRNMPLIKFVHIGPLYHQLKAFP